MISRFDCTTCVVHSQGRLTVQLEIPGVTAYNQVTSVRKLLSLGWLWLSVINRA